MDGPLDAEVETILIMRCLGCQNITPPENERITMENPPWMKMCFLVKMGIFQCHVNFQPSWSRSFAIKDRCKCRNYTYPTTCDPACVACKQIWSWSNDCSCVYLIESWLPTGFNFVFPILIMKLVCKSRMCSTFANHFTNFTLYTNQIKEPELCWLIYVNVSILI